jgi:multidrug resistance efflux pump
VVGAVHFFSYLIPLTDDAFVVANSQPVAADVSGYITEIYIKNGQKVKKGEPLFKVFDTPYKLAYQKAQANYEEAVATIAVIRQQTSKNEATLSSMQQNLAKATYEYNLKKNPVVSKSVSTLEIQKLDYDVQSFKDQVKALQNQISIDDKQIIQQQKRVASLKAEMDNAAVNLELTTVRAGSNGVVDNMYLALGTPIVQHQPLFSFVDTDNWYVQANFNETDLRYARPGDKVTIILRMYYFDKIFHGVIVNNLWVADRQNVVAKTQQQQVKSENEWLNLPQRFPLQIKVTDPDPRYPLNPGSSAFVYIHTH